MMMKRPPVLKRLASTLKLSAVAVAAFTLSFMSVPSMHSGGFISKAYAACSNPTGVESQMIYNAAHNVMQYCDDTNWIAMTGGQFGDEVVVSDGLVGYWKLDETGGTSLADVTGNYDASWSDNGGSSTVVSVPGVVGNAIQTVSLSDGAQVNDTGTVFDAKTNFSVSAWAQTNSTSEDAFILWKAEGGAPWFGWHLSFDIPGTPGIVFEVMNTGGSGYKAKWNGTLEADTWYHVVGVKEGTDLKIYVNGVDSSDIKDTYSGTVRDATSPFYFGDPWGSDFADVQLDEARFYDRALSAAEVAELYECGINGNCGSVLECISDGSWSLVSGSGSSIAGTDFAAVTALDENTVAIADSNLEDITTYRWNGSSWSQVGNAFPVSGLVFHDITALDSNTIALIDNGNDFLNTYRFDGTDWSLVGNSYDLSATIGTTQAPGITALNSNTVVAADGDWDGVQVFSWDGTDWSMVGSTFSTSGVFQFPGLTALDSSTVVLVDEGDDVLRTLSWNGSALSAVGSSLSISTTDPQVTRLTSNTVAFIDAANDSLRTYKWDGSTWSLVGSGSALTTGFSGIEALNSTTIAWLDRDADELRLYETATSGTCTGQSCLLNQEGEVTYNNAYGVPQFCDGSQWVSMVGGSDIVVNDGLVSYWTFDDGTGSTIAADSVGNNDGTLTNMDENTDWVSGQIGGAIDVDSGGSQRIAVSDHSSLNFGTSQDFSFSFWLYPQTDPATDQYHYILGKTDTTGYWCILNTVAGNESIKCEIEDSGGAEEVSTTAVITSADTWYHVVWTVDRDGDMQLYIDGSASGSPTDVSGVGDIDDTADFWIGDAYFDPVNALIDDVRLYNRVLAPSEVSQLYACGEAGNCGGGNSAWDGSSPCSTAGAMIYNADHDVMQYCDGSNWKAIGKFP